MFLSLVQLVKQDDFSMLNDIHVNSALIVCVMVITTVMDGRYVAFNEIRKDNVGRNLYTLIGFSSLNCICR